MKKKKRESKHKTGQVNDLQWGKGIVTVNAMNVQQIEYACMQC